MAILFKAWSRFRLAPRESLQWYSNRLALPAWIIEECIGKLAECRIAPAESLYASAAE